MADISASNRESEPTNEKQNVGNDAVDGHTTLFIRRKRKNPHKSSHNESLDGPHRKALAKSDGRSARDHKRSDEWSFDEISDEQLAIGQKHQRKLNPLIPETGSRSQTNTTFSNNIKYNFEQSKLNEATKSSNWHDGEIGTETINSKSGGTDISLHNESDLSHKYTGINNYQKFTEPQEVLNKKALPGPQRAMNNVRTVTIVDYQPDVCKDYKETGFCGFGDSCKFLHDREVYKQGWELDREWEDVQKRKGSSMQSNYKESAEGMDSEESESIPFACFICRKDYTNPVVTRCNHYFCENCALTRYKRVPTCAICGARTNGIFNKAKTLITKLDAKKLRAAQKAS